MFTNTRRIVGYPEVIHLAVSSPFRRLVRHATCAIKGVLRALHDEGGRVHITTHNPEALGAIHEFLRYQILEHQTGDLMKAIAVK